MKQSSIRNYSEYLALKLLLKLLSILPRPIAYAVGKYLARFAYLLTSRLRDTAQRNLKLAMPELSASEQQRIVKGVFDNFGRLLVEFSRFPKYTREQMAKVVEYDGLENYFDAMAKGRGVLFLTGHLGAWELSAFAHSINGHPHNILVRRIDNPFIERLVDRYRTLHGNRTIDKNNASRMILSALRRGEAVGILIDLNTVRNLGVFCDFFGIQACCTPGLATLALRTGAAVLPSFITWDGQRQIHTIHFGKALEIVNTGNLKEDILTNTARFHKVVEEYVRRYPEQWLWVHKRWKTRPEGEAELY